jgi:hypothetical protein
MRAAALLLLLAGACDGTSQRSAPARPVRPARRVHLTEWFELSAGGPRCRVDTARHILAESSTRPYRDARVRPDVHALELELSCESASGAAISSREALPLDTMLLLERGAETRAARPPSASDARDRLLFELPEPGVGYLPAPRRYALDSGDPVVEREREVASLRIEARAGALEVVLRERLHDAALDRLLDQLARALGRVRELDVLAAGAEGSAALRDLGRTFADVRERFRPARLELVQLAASATGLDVVLSATRPRARARSFEVARFELGLVREGDGAWRVRSFDNRVAARAALECDRLEEALQRELGASSARAGEQHCNALGTLLPGACGEVEPGLLERALLLGARCRTARVEQNENAAPAAGASEAQGRAGRRALPDDFQVTLRRGRSAGGLDRDPRYVVALFHQGQVVFHGRHWVTSKERSDGRTMPELLAGLYAHVERLDWFGRRGGHYDAEGCVPSEDDGDVITITAANRQRMVLSRDGCRGPFSEPELTSLRRHIERVAGIWGWTEPQRQSAMASADPRVETWAIAE